MKILKPTPAILFIICAIFVSFCTSSWANTNKNTEGITVKIPHDSPKLNLLDKNFVLVPRPSLPKEYTNINDNWLEVIDRHNQDVFAVNQIPIPKQHKEQWARLSKMLPPMPPVKKLRNINGFFNSIPSQEDAYNYKEKEYWATPQEFLKKRAGDCEDYAIAKYFALQYFNWPSDALWIVFLRDNINKGLHVVLATRHEGKGFILDNLSKPAYLLIPEAQYAKQVQVIALLNAQGMWLPLKEK